MYLDDASYQFLIWSAVCGWLAIGWTAAHLFASIVNRYLRKKMK